MLNKILEYTGEYKKYTRRACILLVVGLLCHVAQFVSIYNMISAALRHEAHLSYYLTQLALFL
ncbi:MAG: hypothetical protein VZR32_07925, partial [Candidatus Weimeria sp.]|nr:hypothetical protein [Candidatus Weimeria sp.]